MKSLTTQKYEVIVKDKTRSNSLKLEHDTKGWSFGSTQYIPEEAAAILERFTRRLLASRGISIELDAPGTWHIYGCDDSTDYASFDKAQLEALKWIVKNKKGG